MKKYMTVLYSVLHLLVDGICALAMFGKFIPEEEGHLYILLYNFCAFALQMPFGVILDALNNLNGEKRRGGNDGQGNVERIKPEFAFLMAGTGVLCTMAGAVTHPVLLGMGNALFHVGGGVGTICEDRAVSGRGTLLGLFVAPGALGLYLGNLIAAENEAGGYGWGLWFLGVSFFMLFLLWAGKQHLQGHRFKFKKGWQKQRGNGYGDNDVLRPEPKSIREDGFVPEPVGVCRRYPVLPPPENIHGGYPAQPPSAGRNIRLSFCCLLVVVLRSYIGMAVGFPWKTGVLAGALSVLAMAGGKAAGGFLAAKAGALRTATVSLVMAALCYLFSSLMPAGLAALFLFNMTMPVTLYWMVCAFPQMPGFAFGFLTFALFLGFLPGYFELQPLWNGSGIGCAGSVLSLLLLAAGLGKGGCGEKRSG